MANINRQQKEKNEIYIRAFLVGSNWQGGGGKVCFQRPEVCRMFKFLQTAEVMLVRAGLKTMRNGVLSKLFCGRS